MNAFQKMMNDIFQCEDFLEDCLIENRHYKCITSPIVDNVSFSDSGLVDEENFTLDIKLPVSKMPKQNDKVKFRDKWYKIGFIETDSANTSIKIHIIALSKGIG
jgi:hypothetical protein